MDDFKVVTLPSGAELKIGLASIERADALFEAVMFEARGVQISNRAEMFAAMKDLSCVFFSSKPVKAALKECMKTVLYNGEKITTATFDPREARQDLPIVYFEVAQENLAPFMTSLFALLFPLLAKLEGSQA